MPTKCSEPFADKDELKTAVNAFWDEVEASREKHKIADVYLSIHDSYFTPDGGAKAYTSGGFGNQTEWESMLARSLGKEQQRRRTLINRLLAGDSK